ncbi:MAG: DUF6165 family protein [Brevundimonas sp.]|uniref:DUF6165 family protein n=1 Tax=Brevundimonas sp. TaxID=1871086 RepID=UPI0024873748|nr:DUF6165 family protein [Brevundimonas sp.]MDI1326965.1 DUF6165 family protein [Brevundimonas sp.]
MIVTAPIAVGELFDKITILRLKAAKLRDPARVANVTKELQALEAMAAGVPASPALDSLVGRLHQINAALWEVEDGKRAHEREHRFDADFIQLARRVYLENDLRAAIKREINTVTGSALTEEKSYDQ